VSFIHKFNFEGILTADPEDIVDISFYIFSRIFGKLYIGWLLPRPTPGFEDSADRGLADRDTKFFSNKEFVFKDGCRWRVSTFPPQRSTNSSESFGSSSKRRLGKVRASSMRFGVKFICSESNEKIGVTNLKKPSFCGNRHDGASNQRGALSTLKKPRERTYQRGSSGIWKTSTSSTFSNAKSELRQQYSEIVPCRIEPSQRLFRVRLSDII
jgi:hypothetical protein